MKHKFSILSCAAVLLTTVGWLVWRGGEKAPSPAASQAPPAIAPPKPPPLDPVVARIVHEGPATPYLRFNYLIKDLSTDLRPHDIHALITFITGPQPITFTPAQWGSLTNDIQEALSVQTQPRETVARALIATFRDENQARMLRDYALQHIGGLAIYLVHTAHTRQGTLPPFFGDLTGELTTAAQDQAHSWSGTALNLLDGILRAAEYRGMALPGITPDSLVALALPAVNDASASLNVRLPALQLASRRGSPEALSVARAILADPASPLMLVQSAAAVLATRGTRNDLAILETLRSQNKPHTRPAVDRAIREISQR